jgi:hypothetical protein
MDGYRETTLSLSPVALRSSDTKLLLYILEHFGGNLERITRVHGVKEDLLQLLFRMALLIGTHQLTDILAGAAVSPRINPILHELFHGVGERDIHCLHSKALIITIAIMAVLVNYWPILCVVAIGAGRGS